MCPNLLDSAGTINGALKYMRWKISLLHYFRKVKLSTIEIMEFPITEQLNEFQSKESKRVKLSAPCSSSQQISALKQTWKETVAGRAVIIVEPFKVAEQEGLEPPTLSGSRFQGGVFIQPGLLHRGRLQKIIVSDAF